VTAFTHGPSRRPPRPASRGDRGEAISIQWRAGGGGGGARGGPASQTTGRRLTKAPDVAIVGSLSGRQHRECVNHSRRRHRAVQAQAGAGVVMEVEMPFRSGERW
jgi:hypothetical protein